MRRAVWIALAAVAFAGGCDRKQSAGRASDGGAGAAAPVADAAAYRASGKRPANARRTAAPPEIARALDVGAKAPDVQLASVSGTARGTFHLSDVLAKERALIVFYRGDW